MKEYYINDDGIKLHAKLDMPEGVSRCPLAIVVHGYTGHMEETHIVEVAKAINEAGIATLRVEMYGHGGSDGEFKNHTLYKWVSNMLAVVDHVSTLDFVTDLYITGHSQGGLLVMLIAGMCPDKFKAVIPLSPAWMIPEAARKGELLGTAFDPVNIPDEILQGGENRLSGNYARVAQTIHPEDEIARYNGPVLIIHGDKDEAVPYEYGKKAAELYKNAKLVTIEGDDHCYNNHLDKVTAAIKDFLA
ncbi:MAG: alpha/beta fold hydrolase [Lachnospiraceae bacterium]|nr:alpha/beta fold hydrolase [Lachnospiraceae bacterium]